MAEKYKTCKHSTGEYGQTAVYVHQSCPRLSMIKGILVSSKRRCTECKNWEESQKQAKKNEAIRRDEVDD